MHLASHLLKPQDDANGIIYDTERGSSQQFHTSKTAPEESVRDVETYISTHHNSTAVPRLLLLVCERQSKEECSTVAWLL